MCALRVCVCVGGGLQVLFNLLMSTAINALALFERHHTFAEQASPSHTTPSDTATPCRWRPF